MKKVFNYKQATVGDLESDGLLFEATKIHTWGFKLNGRDVMTFRGSSEESRIRAFFKHHIDNKIPLVGHNFICFDIPLFEKLYDIDLSELIVIDTLWISWYLNHDREIHGLDSFFEDYGIAKPEVAEDDWAFISDCPEETEAHYQRMKHRVEEDVKINSALWEDLVGRLEDMYSISKIEIDSGNVGGTRMSPEEEIYLDRFKGFSVEEWVNEILTFLMFKADCARLQEKTMWEVDVPYLKEAQETLSSLVREASEALESVMPKVPEYRARKQPKSMFLKSTGELSKAGTNWERLKELLRSEEVDEYGNPLTKVVNSGEIHELAKYNEPNINSHSQVKDFLFSKGWVPETFKYVRDKEVFEEWIKSKPTEGSKRGAWKAWSESRPVDREIPQINMEEDGNKTLCYSIVRMAEEIPEINTLQNYSVITHRLGTINGFIRDLKFGKYLQARVGGLTNTLRMKHREIELQSRNNLN